MVVKASDRVTLAVLPSPSYVRVYYLVQEATLSAPGKPTTLPPPAAWKTQEPAYTAGSTNILYTVMVTAYGSVSFEYGDVQKSSSFEAAKQAYNQAVASGLSADEALTASQQAQAAADDAKRVAENSLYISNLAKELAEGLVDLSPSMPENPLPGQVWISQDEKKKYDWCLAIQRLRVAAIEYSHGSDHGSGRRRTNDFGRAKGSRRTKCSG